ncbi:GMC oxidoreductase [uncultured Chitinophaga sp.]|jgi:Choline dehydrogenase and related flavoproteins|uniref:GMC oxidoreductase n=1 Tax=uncultured Chitinophaga sp. TaxID=339340 RepID=UPI00262074AC|nr:GMC oxidoreductase [uncultured Chitinophaga sp.]
MTGTTIPPENQGADQLVYATFDVLYTLWFPFLELPIPPRAQADISAISKGVQASFWQSVSAGSNALLSILQGITYPQHLPFIGALKSSTNPVIQKFITVPGGMGGLTTDEASQVLSFFFEGTAGPLSTEMAMVIREAYLTVIWDLPLGVPLTGIQVPETFVSNTDIYSNINYPKIPPSRLFYDPATQRILAREGMIDYLVIGSGPAGATVAHELQQAGKKVVLVEQGPFVVWGSMNTMSYPKLMFGKDAVSTSDNGILVRSGQAMGGGTTVNIDLAFSPLEDTIHSRISDWIDKGFIDGRFYTTDRLAAAYQWVRNIIHTRPVTQCELNRDNRALWDGANAYGVDPSLYHLNRFQQDLSPSPVTQKRDAARQLILPAMEDSINPLSVIPDVAVQELLFDTKNDGTVYASGASLLVNAPWTEFHNTIVDPCGFQIPPGTQVKIYAENVILSAGTIGSTKILLNTAQKQPALKNPRIGKGLIMHPSFPLIGVFNERINLLEGLDSATYLDAFGVTPGFIFETMSGMPAYGAVLIPGNGLDVFRQITKFNQSVGFGVMLVDTPSDDNCITLNNGSVVLNYSLSEADKARFRTGVAIAIRMMFLAGAKQVIIPTNENVLGLDNFDPMRGCYLDDIQQADLVEQNLQFIPNRTVLTSAHLQATNKMGASADTSVASTRQRIWNMLTKEEISNLYLMDSSMFPTSVGANPMQSLYTFAKIFSQRLLDDMDAPGDLYFRSIQSDRLARGPVTGPVRAGAGI